MAVWWCLMPVCRDSCSLIRKPDISTLADWRGPGFATMPAAAIFLWNSCVVFFNPVWLSNDSRIFIPIIFAIVLPDLYFDTHYLRHRLVYKWGKRMLWWFAEHGDACLYDSPHVHSQFRAHRPPRGSMSISCWWDCTWCPKAIIAFCSSLGLLYCRLSHTRKNWGNLIAPVLCLFSLFVLIYGSVFGFRGFHVAHVDIYSKDLPAGTMAIASLSLLMPMWVRSPVPDFPSWLEP